ncbi:hypothetical protein C8R41DRAFT_854348 [Lentinula lateritia]|uniref:Uncharacterized protein n=1 Tax=Lentinula lateritia TaxID=40482 RepID=A0ABQ8V1U9_9AGAR|nr:hypothetical protein C8R41DRAFT_854348 [Lentinula lateritia]
MSHSRFIQAMLGYAVPGLLLSIEGCRVDLQTLQDYGGLTSIPLWVPTSCLTKLFSPVYQYYQPFEDRAPLRGLPGAGIPGRSRH